MLLRDSLDDAVADVFADLPTLTTAARKQGLAVRRRRRALATVGTAAAATFLAATAYVLAPGSGGTDPQMAADLANPVRVGPLSGRTAPSTNRAVAAALVDAVDQAADGTFGRFQGAAYDYEGAAALLFEPVSGSGPAGQVMINLQPLAMAGKPPYSCSGAWFPAMTDCETLRLSNGDTLRTYRELGDSEYGAGSQRQAVELISPDRRLRVVVNALNTNPWADGAMRDAPVLTVEQATRIATRPWWARKTLPVEYVEAGEHLPGVEYIGADAVERR